MLQCIIRTGYFTNNHIAVESMNVGHCRPSIHLCNSLILTYECLLLPSTAAAVLSNLSGQLGITTPTPVQMQVLPAILMDRDVLVSASTGSGKSENPTLGCMVCAQGRNLNMQKC